MAGKISNRVMLRVKVRVRVKLRVRVSCLDQYYLLLVSCILMSASH
jgi:hypothetical protein